MPIKFKCKCGQVMSVPSKMAGKSGKCPKCKNTLKVPAPKTQVAASSSGKAAPQKKSAPAASAAPAAMDGAFDELFDEVGLTKKSGPSCPECLKEIRPGTVICTHCGFNLETGEKLTGFDAKVQGPEFDNLYLQEAADNMVREDLMDSRRDKSQMPWWVIMSFLIGAVTLCAAGIVIVEGKLGEPADESTFMGKVQRWPVFTTLGLTVMVTGTAITTFANFSITIFAFFKSIGQGFLCLFMPLLYSLVYGILNWADNKAAVKAIIMGLCIVGFGVFLIIQGGGFGIITAAFR